MRFRLLAIGAVFLAYGAGATQEIQHEPVRRSMDMVPKERLVAERNSITFLRLSTSDSAPVTSMRWRNVRILIISPLASQPLPTAIWRH